MNIKYLFIGLFQFITSLIVVPLLFIIYDIRLRKLGPWMFGKATIYSSNHRTWFDPPLLGTIIPRPVRLVAKKELFNNYFAGKLLTGLGAFPINRAVFDLKSIRKMINIMKIKKGLIIFPEGTRNKTNDIRDGKAGIGFLVRKARRASILPIRIRTGKGGSLGRNYFKVIFGGAYCINMNLFEDTPDKEAYKKIAVLITDNIRRLEWD